VIGFRKQRRARVAGDADGERSPPLRLAQGGEREGRGALTIGIASNAGAPLLSEADHPIHLDTGPEAIAGSTRMKAGTAQKAALNCLSSLVMIRLGRVHDGLMVDMQAGNAKLARRAEAMLAQLTGCGEAEAREALARAGGSVKLAVLLIEGAGSAEEAEARLARAGGRLRDALQSLDCK